MNPFAAAAREGSMRRRVADERGVTLVELVVVMSILAIVLTALTTLFVSASRAQLDLSNRFQAQQNARLALDKLRREIHCAKEVTGTGSQGTPTQIVITLGAYCPTNQQGVDSAFTWCATPAALSSGGPYTLWRYVGASCAGTGRRWADHLTSANVFPTCGQVLTQLKTIAVDLTVDITPADAKQQYRLKDDIVLRNSARDTLGSTCP
jgi:prepilin-type N-terminal cleavage/methylation domain-containing protein